MKKNLSLAAVSLLALSTTVPMEAGPVGIVPGRLLVKPKAGASVADAVRPFNGQEVGEIPGIGVAVVKIPDHALQHALQGLSRNPHIEFAEPDFILEPDATPNDPYYPSSWHLSKVAAPTAWDTTQGSTGVTIAILDTGVDGSHPDLSAKLVAGWNTYDNNSNTSDVHGHGTQVAGSAAALSNNGLGVAGLSWNSPIMPIRISDLNGYGYYSTIAAGLNWAADHGAKVANVSFAVTTSSTVQTAAKYFQSKGGVVTVAAGNSALFDSSADTHYIITVSATTSSDTLASWSNTGSNIDVSAPGVGIYTTARGGGYASVSGTSFSAPITAGVAALVLSAQPGLTPAEVTQILENSADDLGAAGFDTSFGWGRVNAANAVSLAASLVVSEPTEPEPTTTEPAPAADTEAPQVVITSPTSTTRIQRNMSVEVDATDNVAVTLVELYVDGKMVSSSTSAPFTLKWNTQKLSNGYHDLQTKAYDAAGNSAISAVVTVRK